MSWREFLYLDRNRVAGDERDVARPTALLPVRRKSSYPHRNKFLRYRRVWFNGRSALKMNQRPYCGHNLRYVQREAVDVQIKVALLVGSISDEALEQLSFDRHSSRFGIANTQEKRAPSSIPRRQALAQHPHIRRIKPGVPLAENSLPNSNSMNMRLRNRLSSGPHYI